MPVLEHPNIARDDLVRIVEEASEGCTDSSRRKWRAVAATTHAVSAGWFHCEGVGCVARQARRHNQRFQARFDELIAVHYGLRPSELSEDPFVLFVVDVDAR